MRKIILSSSIAAMFVVLTTPAGAGGIYMSEVGTPNSLGTAASGNVTISDSPDAAWANPAGMTGMDEARMFAGIQVLIPEIRFDSTVAEAGGSDGGNAGSVAGIPSFFYARPINDSWRFGVSVVAPFGGGFDFGDDFVGRYSVQEFVLQGLGVSASFGYKVNDRLSLGFGATITYTMMDMDFAINQSAIGAPDGQVNLEDATDLGVQPFLGLQLQYGDGAIFGLVYRGEMDVDLEGDLRIRDLALPLSPQSSFEFSWDNPQLIEIGIRQPVSDRWTLTANANWEDWSAFGENVLTINDAPTGPLVQAIDRNWKDTYKFGLGFIRQGDDGKKLAFGASYDTSPVDDEDRTVDLPSDEQLRLSFAYGRDTGGKRGWSVGITYTWLGDGKVDQIAQDARFVGKFEDNTILFIGATYQHRFGR